MKPPTLAPKAKLFLALMYKDKSTLEKVKQELINEFGEIDYQSEEYKFNFTDYYEQEMGKNLKKFFISFKTQIKRESLPDIRLTTAKIEKKFLKNNNRTINIDPGYITLNNLVLATVKDRPHKIYLGKGIYADLNLILKKKGAFDFPWTFKDYKLKQNQNFFNQVRNDLLKSK